jgi:hypothetical protein
MWWVIRLGLLPLALACSTTSTISRITEPDVEADIVGGSRDSIFVSTDDGSEYEIPRRDISSIDYPGNVHTAIGAGILGYGVLNIAVGMDECQDRRDQQAAFCTGVFTPAILGAALMTWGIIVNQGQKSSAFDQSRPAGESTEEPSGRFPSWASGRRAPAPRPKAIAPVAKPTAPPAAEASEPVPAPPAPNAEPTPAQAPAESPATPAPASGPSKAFPVES